MLLIIKLPEGPKKENTILMIILISNNLFFQCNTNSSHNMESEIAQYVTRAENAELQIQDLVKELEALEKGVVKKDKTKR